MSKAQTATSPGNPFASDALYERFRNHASRRFRFGPETPAPERLRALRQYLSIERELLLRYQRRGEPGRRVARARAIMLDVLLERLLELALIKAEQSEAVGKAPKVVLLALGGYGRGEMCPLSDIDVMFLYEAPGKSKESEALLEILTSEVLYPLWDLGMKVGYSLRTIKEALAEAASEDKSFNAFMEVRRVAGEVALYEAFMKAFDKFTRSQDARAYLKTRLENQSERRERHGNNVYLQEPDIKNGAGGLRDYQSLLWMARFRLGDASIEALVSNGYLSAKQAERLENAYDYLLRVRNELHFNSKRATDLLTLEQQPRIAWGLGYHRESLFKRVEEFMRDYYSAAATIFRSCRLLERRLALSHRPGGAGVTFKNVVESRRLARHRLQDGFIIGEESISYESRKVFEDDPVRLVRVFRYAQQFEVDLDLELQVLISESLELLTPTVARKEHTSRAFRSILQSPGQVYPILMQMHELRVLGQVLPEFRPLTCLVQHEYYHRYTADIHTLATIEQLDRVFAGDDEQLRGYRSALRETSLPALLYLMLLLHDIGKGVSIKGHAEIGVGIAEPILQRLGISDKHREVIYFIIRHHLEMARFWQRYDLDDPRTTSTFCELVQDEDTLRYLYVLTFCDAMGTADGLWNGYKDALHRKLFKQALDFLSEDHDVLAARRNERRKMIQEEVAKLVAATNLPEDQVEAHFNLLPQRYFVQRSADEIVLHMQMIARLLENITKAESLGTLAPVIEWHNNVDQGFTVVNVVTWDRAGLFYKLAGALTVAGVNILSTKAISRGDHISIDTFYIVEPGAGVVRNPEAQKRFEQCIEDALMRGLDLLPEIERISRENSERLRLKQTTRLQAPIPPQVDVYHEISLRRTIVEIQATDHLGLLYQLAKTIYDHGYDITFARIGTERGAAIDTFYIEPIDGAGPDSNAALVQLRDSLKSIVQPEEYQAAG